MTGIELLAGIAVARKNRVKTILEAPENFKVCNGCQSILSLTTVFCPFCKCYGFERDRNQVIAMAEFLSDRALAFGCAVLPRETSVRALTNA